MTTQVDVEQVAGPGAGTAPPAETTAPVAVKRPRKPSKKIQAMLDEAEARGVDKGLNMDKGPTGLAAWLLVALVVGVAIGRWLKF
jgi:hypothetical protein